MEGTLLKNFHPAALMHTCSTCSQETCPEDLLQDEAVRDETSTLKNSVIRLRVVSLERYGRGGNRVLAQSDFAKTPMFGQLANTTSLLPQRVSPYRFPCSTSILIEPAYTATVY